MQEVDILYTLINDVKSDDFGDVVDRMTNNRLPPDRILIICPKGAEIGIKNAFESISHSTKVRLRNVSHVSIAPFDLKGKIEDGSLHVLIQDGLKKWTVSDKDVDDILRNGMENIINRTSTIMPAPAGYEFRKPSQSASRIFIRAGNMLSDPAALAVIFHALVRSLPPKKSILYIDSFTILSIALTYQRYVSSLAKSCGESEYPEPSIVNLHSYSIDKKMRFPSGNDYVILISATSSGGFAKILSDEHRADKSLIYHLISITKNSTLKSNSIYFDHQEEIAPLRNDLYKKTISIPGEEFMASHGDTRTVNLAMEHLVPYEKRIYIDPFYQKSLVRFLGGTYGKAHRPLGLQKQRSLGSKEFLIWLERQALIEIPASTTMVVAVDSKRSLGLARYLFGAITGRVEKKRRKEMSLLTLDQLLKKGGDNEAEKDESVLIVCSDDGDGDNLLATSQALRGKGHMHRHYLIGHLFPSSSHQYRKLKSNLTKNGKGVDYGWSEFCVTPIGEAALHDSWLVEQRFDYRIRKIQALQQEFVTAMHRRQVALGDVVLKDQDLFLPRLDGKALTLRKESVFFDRGYDSISQVVVYLQVAAALQRARDGKLCDNRTRIPEEKCFQNNPFIDSVIDPDTFSRFNDGIIQASILRASAASEVNYSRDERLSGYMLQIFSSLVLSRKTDRGEAVLEFVLAIAIKKLLFHNKHIDKVENLINKTSDLKEIWKLLKQVPIF